MDEGSSAFEAGKASATAEQAKEDVAEVEQVAEQAESTAEAAVDIAAEANNNAWDAKAAVGELAEEVRSGFAEIKGMISPPAAEGDGGPPAPTPKQKEAPAAELAADADPEPKDKGKATGGKHGLGMWR